MKSLYLYFTLGYPDFSTLNRFVSGLDSTGVTGVELGFPSRDPHYDGPAIRKTHSVALANGPDGSEETIEILSKKGIPMYSLSYYSDIGGNLDAFLDFLSERKFTGTIIPDTFVDYFDEYADIIRSCQDHGIQFIPFFNASTPDRVIQDAAAMTQSWIYFGVQPSTGINVPFNMEEASGRMRDLVGNRELVYGFGLRGTDQIREVVQSGGDGVAIGSMLVPMLESGNFKEFDSSVKEIRRALNDCT